MGKGRQRRARTGSEGPPEPTADDFQQPPAGNAEHEADIEMLADAIGRAELADERELDTSGPVNSYTLRNGIKLKLKRIPPTLLSKIASQVPQPKPPEFVVDETTGRTDTNPDDPDYKEALQDWVQDRSEAAFAAAAVFGCTVDGELPEGILPPESDEWIDEIEAVFEATGEAIEIARAPAGKRFFHWLQYYAIDDDADLFAVSRIITARTVITERELADMVSHFRRMAVGFPDLIGATTGWSGSYGDQIPEPDPGDRLGV